MADYLERQEGPDGQWCDLLTRVPYDNQRIIEAGMAAAQTVRDQQDACLRGLLWEANVKDVLTGEFTNDVGRAATEVAVPWRERAVVLYNTWYKAAMPGPKGSARTGRPTRNSGRTGAPSGTSAET